MKKIRNWSLVFLSVVVLLWGLHAFLFDWVVPKTASLTIPRKWQMMPLRETKNIVHDYLGEPVSATETFDSTREEWTNGSKGKMYYLHVYYSMDTIAITYTIHYAYKNWLLTRSYLLDSVTIR